MPDTWIVETFYNTDPEGKWVDYDDWSNRTLHGPFDTEKDAMEFMEDFQADDTDVKDMLVRVNTDPVEWINSPDSTHPLPDNPDALLGLVWSGNQALQKEA